MRFEKYPKYTLRKLTIGLTSVIVSTIILTSHNAHAAEENVASIANVETTENVLNNSPNTPVENNQNIETGGRDDNDHESTNPIVLKNYDQVKDADLSRWFDYDKGKATIYLKFKGKDGKDYVTPYLSGSNRTVTTPDFLVDYSQIDPNSLELVVLYQNGDDDYDPFRTDYTGVYDPSERTIYSTTQTFLNLKEIQRYLSVHGYTVQFAKNTRADDHLEPMQIYAYDNNQLKMLYEENTGDGKGEIGNPDDPDNPTGKKAIRFYFSVILSIIVNDTITYYAGEKKNPAIWGFILALVSLLTLFGIDLRQKDQSSKN